MTSLLNDVNTLIAKRVGDLARLEHIKETIENNKQLYDSDRKYLDELIEKHLFPKTQSEQNSPSNNVEQSTTEPSNPKTENNPKSENIPENNPKTQGSFCVNCGASKPKEHDFCIKCGQQNNPNFQRSTRSNFWYLLPIVFGLAGGIFGIVGGSIAYLVLRKSDPKKGKYCLIIGICFTLIGVIFGVVAMDSIPTEIPSSENDWVEEYWAQHPDEDPCNDPTARAFGLCK